MLRFILSLCFVVCGSGSAWAQGAEAAAEGTALTAAEAAKAAKAAKLQAGGAAMGMAGGVSGVSQVAAVGNGMAATGYGIECSSEEWPSCVMAAGFAYGAVTSLSTAKDANRAGGDLKNIDHNKFDDPANFDTTPFVVDGRSYTPAGITSDMNNMLGKLKAKGIEVDTKNGTIKTKKGTASLSSLGSGKAMAAAGLISPTEIEIVDEKLKKTNAAIQASILRAGQGGGGGGSYGGSRKPSSDTDYTFNMPGYGGLGGDKPNAPKTSGLSVLVGGEPVGASTGHFLNAISERYKKLRQQGEFGKQAQQ